MWDKGRSNSEHLAPSPTETTVRYAVKSRLTIAGLVLAALPFVVSSVAVMSMGLASFLNLLWFLLVIGALAHWVADNRRGCARLPGLVVLVFVLTLLFPVISANDDLAQLDLINDAKTLQSIGSNLKTEKQLWGSAGLLGLPAGLAVKVTSFVLTSESVFELVHVAFVAITGSATGNHSPPLC